LDELPELAHGHFVDADVKRLSDADRVLRSFRKDARAHRTIVFAQQRGDFLLRASHQKLAGRDEPQLHPDRILVLHGHTQVLGPGDLALAGHIGVEGDECGWTVARKSPLFSPLEGYKPAIELRPTGRAERLSS
jgi:hypothetical protein